MSVRSLCSAAQLLNIRSRFRIFPQHPFRHNVPNGDLIPKRFHLAPSCYVWDIIADQQICGYGRSQAGTDRADLGGSLLLKSCSLFAQQQKVKARRSSNKGDGRSIGHTRQPVKRKMHRRDVLQPQDTQSRPGVKPSVAVARASDVPTTTSSKRSTVAPTTAVRRLTGSVILLRCQRQRGIAVQQWTP